MPPPQRASAELVVPAVFVPVVRAAEAAPSAAVREEALRDLAQMLYHGPDLCAPFLEVVRVGGGWKAGGKKGRRSRGRRCDQEGRPWVCGAALLASTATVFFPPSLHRVTLVSSSTGVPSHAQFRRLAFELPSCCFASCCCSHSTWAASLRWPCCIRTRPSST